MVESQILRKEEKNREFLPFWAKELLALRDEAEQCGHGNSKR